MPRILTAAIMLGLMSSFAGSALAQPFVVVYASEAACDLSGIPIDANPTVQPSLPAIKIPVGEIRTLELCFIVLPVADSTEGEMVCNDGTGTESCAEQVQFRTAFGMRITGFGLSVPGSGIESPGITASLAIAEQVVKMAGQPLE